MQIRDLSVLAYAQGFTLWHTKLRDHALAAVKQPGYFNDARDLLAAGDMILASGAHGATVLLVAAVPNDGADVLTGPLA